MVFNTLAVGIAVISRLRRVAWALYFDLCPVRVGTAPPQSLQSCSRFAVAIHCSVTKYCIHGSNVSVLGTRHLVEGTQQRLVGILYSSVL